MSCELLIRISWFKKITANIKAEVPCMCWTVKFGVFLHVICRNHKLRFILRFKIKIDFLLKLTEPQTQKDSYIITTHLI